MAVPSFVLGVRELPKNSTDVPMMATRFTTLHTPWDTGLTRDSVLKANCSTQAHGGMHYSTSQGTDAQCLRVQCLRELCLRELCLRELRAQAAAGTQSSHGADMLPARQDLAQQQKPCFASTSQQPHRQRNASCPHKCLPSSSWQPSERCSAGHRQNAPGSSLLYCLRTAAPSDGTPN